MRFIYSCKKDYYCAPLAQLVEHSAVTLVALQKHNSAVHVPKGRRFDTVMERTFLRKLKQMN